MEQVFNLFVSHRLQTCATSKVMLDRSLVCSEAHVDPFATGFAEGMLRTAGGSGAVVEVEPALPKACWAQRGFSTSGFSRYA